MTSGGLAEVWPLRQEHGQSGNALHRPPRVWTFDFEDECVAAIKLSEQYFHDTIGWIPFAFSVNGNRAFEQQHAGDELGGRPRVQAVGIEQSQFPGDPLYFRAQLGKDADGHRVSRLSGSEGRRSGAARTCRSSDKRGPDCFPKSDRRKNDDSGWESDCPKHNRLTNQNSFRQD